MRQILHSWVKKILHTITLVTHSVVILSFLLPLAGPVSQVSAMDSIPEDHSSIKSNQKPSVKMPGSLPAFLTNSLTKANFSINNKSQDPAPAGRLIRCYFDGDPTLCSSTPSTYITNYFSTIGSAYGGYPPGEKIKIVCNYWGCPKVDVYYSLSCSTYWTEGDYPKNMNLYVSISGTTEVYYNSISCGSGQQGQCSIQANGKVPAANISSDNNLYFHVSGYVSLYGGDAFLKWRYDCSHTWSLDPIPVVQDRSTLSNNSPKNGPGDFRECAVNGCADSQAVAGDPINTRTGNFDYSLVDLSVPTLAGTLSFQRSYGSKATSTSTFPTNLSPGWTHNQDIRLIFESGSVWFKGQTLNQYKFTDNGNQTFTPYSGVLASLSYNSTSSTYTLKVSDQSIYTFNSAGQLISWRNSLGHGFDYTYSDNKLDRVTEPVSGRYLQFYYQNNQLVLVNSNSDPSRQIIFTYDSNGDLSSFSDLEGSIWTYQYDSSHHLTTINDPGNPSKPILTINYDAQGRAYRQYNANNEKIVEILYNSDGTRTIKDALNRSKTDTYDARGVNALHIDTTGDRVRKYYDANFRPIVISDTLNHKTQLVWSSNGVNLTRLSDAIGNTTRLNYNNQNKLTSMVDARGITTTFTYSGSLLLRSTDVMGNSSLYTYTTAADAPTPSGLLKASQDANGNVIQYNYDAYGQRISTADALSHTTQYAYDDLGRLIKTTSPDGRADWSCYDTAGRVIRSVLNASGDGSTPATDPCDVANYQPLVDGLHDHIIQNNYDLSGNLIASTDPAGRITRTYYDNAGRAIYTVQNLQNWAESNASPPPLNLRTNEANLTTKTSYDASGKVIAVTESIVEGTSVYSQTNRTYYDSLGRPEYQVENLTGQDFAVNTPPSGSYPADQNVTTRNYYDAAGNPIATKDPLGRIARTYYDALNRPYLVIQGWSGSNLYSTTPPTCNRGDGATTNICSETFYDQNGNAIAERDAKGVTTRTYYDAVNRPVLVVRSLTSQAYNVQTLPSSSTFDNSHDVATQTVYDPAGNAIAAIEWLKKDGQVISHTTRTYFDALQRPVLVVRNLDPEHSIQDPNPPECNRDASGQADPVNVCTETVYDPGSGDSIASFDPLGRTTRTWYDELHRPTLTIRNLTSQGYEVGTPPASSSFGNSENVASQVLYDSQGRAIASIQWQVKDSQVLSTTTRTFYDGLDRPVSTIQNYQGDLNTTTPPTYDPAHPDQNVRTDTLYTSESRAMAQTEWFANASGQLDSRITRSYYDGVKRVTQTVQNLDPAYGTSNRTPPTCNRDANGTGPITNVCFQTSYRADGSTASNTNSLGKTTSYTYDGLGRLSGQTDPLSYTTSFGYDANGNRVSLTDAKGTLTKYEYDALNRLNAVVENYRAGIPADDQTNVRTEYTYDALGNRLSILDGEGHTTTFTYDALGRQHSESDALGHTWIIAYDVNGNRVGQTDANGNTTTFHYDGLDRLVLTDYPDPDADVTLSYNAFGERLAMQDGLGNTTWQYDGLGRAITITQPISGTVGYAFDALGNRTQLRYPDGKQVQYEYDKLGRLNKVTDWDTRETTYRYNIAGALLTTSLPNGVISTNVYDNLGQVITITHQISDTLLSSFAYQYDAVGNRTRVIENVKTGLVSPTVLISVSEIGGIPLSGKFLYVFNGNTYTGYSKVTDSNGQASITLPAGSYRFRVDVDGTQFWSGSANHCKIGECSSVTLSVPRPVLVTVQDNEGASKEGLNIYAFTGNTYSGYHGVTNANGQIQLRLPEGDYRFRADFNNTQFWSSEQNDCSVPDCSMAAISVTLPVVVSAIDNLNAPRAGIVVYAFNNSTYSGYQATTDTSGQAEFTLPAGNYRFRADFNSTQFWSGSTNHCTVPDCREATVQVNLPLTVTVQDTDGLAKSNISVYAFDGTNYTGFSASTNTDGEAVFTLPTGNYRFRADFNGTQFWSGGTNHCDVPGCSTVEMSVTKPLAVVVRETDGTAKAGLNVYAFNGSTYTGYYKVSGTDGLATFTLPQGDYRFRADLNGTQFWSGIQNHCSLPGCEDALVTVTIPVVVTIQDGSGNPQTGVNVYAFDEGSYTGYSKVSDANGQAVFTLPQGSYRFRADFNGSQYWSGATNHCGLPGCGNVTIVFGSQMVTNEVHSPRSFYPQLSLLSLSEDWQMNLIRSRSSFQFLGKLMDFSRFFQLQSTSTVTITVVNTENEIQPDLNVYAFDGATYTGIQGVTNSEGQVFLALPEGAYHFRADLNGTQFWSGDENHCTIPECSATQIHVTIPLTLSVQDTNGAPKTELNVYAFDGSTYTGYSKLTDENGNAQFTLPEGAYHFRADWNGTQFWSQPENHCGLPGCTTAAITVTLPVTLTVKDTNGTPKSGLSVYAFDGTIYTGYSKISDATGEASFTLPEGNYQFRGDLNGTQFWSEDQNHCSIPGCTTAVLTVTIPITVGVVDTAGNPQVGLNVYAFDGTSYTGFAQVSNLSGETVFTLPEGNYRFRADLNGTQFWSGTENHCTIPSCSSAALTVTVPMTVTVKDTDGVAKAGLNVYAFNGSTYTGFHGVTNTAGDASFTLPQGSYRFRADLGGTQFWSGSENNCSIPGCTFSNITVTKLVRIKVADQSWKAYPNLNVYTFDGNTYSGYTGQTDTSGQVSFYLPQGSYHFRADYDGVQFWSSSENDCSVPGCTSKTITLPGGESQTTTTITYTYDPLNRLTAANYSDGSFYHYEYDAVGNRKTEVTDSTSSTYTYDAANRLASTNGITFTWDANGNQLNDGAKNYSYNSANRLVGVSQGTDTYSFAYNGLGDRYQQTVNGTTTNYALDINTGLTQVLQDGTNSYLYGKSRIYQQAAGDPQYFLGDALGSVRQLVNNEGYVVLGKSYNPYGVRLSYIGSGRSSYEYSGEWKDSTDLINLRTRYLSPWQARFINKDSWQGISDLPLSLNKYLYSFSNPVLFTDPSGSNPLVVCLAAIVADGILPVGDATCALYLMGLGVISVGSIPVMQHSQEIGEDLGLIIDEGCTSLAEQLFGYPVAPTEPELTPQPVPYYIPNQPNIKTTPSPKHIFYFSDVGDYPMPGRKTQLIISDLEKYNRPGMDGEINFLKDLQRRVDSGQRWLEYPLMGRKFEAERAITFARKNSLVRMNSTASGYDLVTINFGSITYIEVKWSSGAIPPTTIRKVIKDAKLHLSGTFLLESNNIDSIAQQMFLDNGGVVLPFLYP